MYVQVYILDKIINILLIHFLCEQHYKIIIVNIMIINVIKE